MSNIQELFLQLLAKKKELKKYKQTAEQACENSQEYKNLKEKRRSINEKIKATRTELISQKEMLAIEDIKVDIQSLQARIADSILVQTVKGEDVKIENEFGQQVLPIFSVKFKVE